MRNESMPDPIQQARGRILAVIVLYKTAPGDSASFRTLRASIEESPDPSLVKMFFYDNTPGGQPEAKIPEGTSCESHAKNSGLATAYNRALAIALEEGYDWLLTLDQDTSLPLDFVTQLSVATSYALTLPTVGAVVPQIRDRQRLISPMVLRLRMLPKFIAEEFVGIALDPTISAVNSAAAVRVSALKSIGGYDPRFTLDYSDAVMFSRLQKNGFRLFVAGNIRVQHELSVMDMKNRVSYERYEDILGAESAFWDECMGGVAGLALLLRFSYRALYKFWRTGGSFAYVKISARYFWRRLAYSRERRMELWQESLRRRFSSSL